MKSIFTEPEVKVIRFAPLDVLTLSPDPVDNGLPPYNGEENP